MKNTNSSNGTKPFQIGIYGKGGIGKSTVTANLTSGLGKMGKKVLQIGCDPKSDSTKLLLEGKKQTPILEILKEKSVNDIDIKDFMEYGYENVCCTESGGPQAGVGCAGRGIITMVEVLRNKGIYEAGFDYIFYDILGDVVCGGFSVPLRKGFADGIIIVTSGEFQSLYAANNICKGLGNLNGKLIGIIGNSRNIGTENELIQEFCTRINSELLAFIPNSRIFWEAEVNRKTVLEYAPQSKSAQIFMSLAKKIVDRNFKLTSPEAMSEKDLEDLSIKYFKAGEAKREDFSPYSKIGNTDAGSGMNNDNSVIKKNKLNPVNTELKNMKANINTCTMIPAKNLKKDINPDDSLKRKPLMKIMSKSLKNREPLHGCSITGAFGVTTQINDYITIMHSPSGCSYINDISNSGSSLIEKIYGTVNKPSLFTRLVQTNLREKDVIFGGSEILKNCIMNMVNNYGQKKMFLVSACASAIIGDDLEKNVNELKLGDDCDITVIDTQGVAGGDYFQGMLDAYRIISEKYIDRNIKPKKDDVSVNLINEKTMMGDTDDNYNTIKKILSQLNIKIHCRFIRDTGIDTIKEFKRASISIPYDDGFIANVISNFLSQSFDIKIFRKLPVGFRETVSWISEIADYFGRNKLIAGLINKYTNEYEQIIERQKKILEGKSVMLFAFNSNLDYVIETIKDLNMKLLKVCFIKSVENEEMDISGFGDVDYNYNETERDKLIKKMKPDIVLTNIPVLETVEGVHYDLMPYYPKIGFFSGVELSKRWMSFFSIDLREGWRNEEKLFNKLQFES